MIMNYAELTMDNSVCVYICVRVYLYSNIT